MNSVSAWAKQKSEDRKKFFSAMGLGPDSIVTIDGEGQMTVSQATSLAQTQKEYEKQLATANTPVQAPLQKKPNPKKKKPKK